MGMYVLRKLLAGTVLANALLNIPGANALPFAAYEKRGCETGAALVWSRC